MFELFGIYALLLGILREAFLDTAKAMTSILPTVNPLRKLEPYGFQTGSIGPIGSPRDSQNGITRGPIGIPGASKRDQ